MNEIFITDSAEMTEKQGELFAKTLHKGDIVLLEGDLGAGKTVFTKGIAKGLGITDTITSPTYTIMNGYKGLLNLYHFDLYRLGDESEFIELGLDDYLDGDGVCVIEWNFIESFQTVPYKIKIEPVDENKRRITICR